MRENGLAEWILQSEDSYNSLSAAAGLLHSDKTAGGLYGSLLKIVQAIINSIQPERVFLADSYFRHQPNNPDLLIILPDSCPRSFDECHMSIADGAKGLPPFTYTLYRSTDIMRRLLEGDIYFSVACAPDNLLYDCGKRAMPLTLKERAKAILVKAGRDFYLGYSRGVSFLESAWYAYRRDEPELTVFLLHQAVELPLRSLLVALTGYELKSHSISKLFQYCRRCAPQIMEIIDPESEQGRRLLILLDHAYIRARYNQLEIEQGSDVLKLLESVHSIHQTILRVFQEKTATFRW